MLNPLNSYHTFRSHPILSAINSFLESSKEIEVSVDRLKKHLVFCYPNTLCFSFFGYPGTINSLNFSSSEAFELTSGEYYKDTRSSDSFLEKEYYSFLSSLGLYFRQKKYQPVMLFDLRFSNKYYRSVLKDFTSDYIRNLKCLIILTQKDAVNLFDEVIVDNTVVVSDLEAVYKKIEELSLKKVNSFNLELPEQLTIESFGEALRNQNFYRNAYNKLAISLDFKKTFYMNSFVIFLLNIFIRTVSPTFGVRWNFFNIERKKLFRKLDDFRTFKINSFFLNLDNDLLYPRSSNIRRFGVYIYDKRTRKLLHEKLSEYLQKIRKMFSDYLDEYISITYEHEAKSHKAKKISMTRYNYISMICTELIENVTLHSRNNGYFAAELKNFTLNIFVGDCGIGLLEGIKENYHLQEKLKSNLDAIETAFNLVKYRKSRALNSPYEGGAGFGLSDTLAHIFNLNGKFLYRSVDAWGSFVNPVARSYRPSKKFRSYSTIRGTQFLIIIPVSKTGINNIPIGTKDFLKWEYL